MVVAQLVKQLHPHIRDPWFESSHWQILLTFNCVRKICVHKTKIKKKRSGMTQFKKVLIWGKIQTITGQCVKFKISHFKIMQRLFEAFWFRYKTLRSYLVAASMKLKIEVGNIHFLPTLISYAELLTLPSEKLSLPFLTVYWQYLV